MKVIEHSFVRFGFQGSVVENKLSEKNGSRMLPKKNTVSNTVFSLDKKYLTKKNTERRKVILKVSEMKVSNENGSQNIFLHF